MTKQERLEIANEFIKVISEHGRRFFHHDGCVSHFKLDTQQRVWLFDKWSKRLVYTHCDWARWRHFTEGGTLRQLVVALREYICGRGSLPLNHLGPWPDWLCDGDLWGYGEEMAMVREECSKLEELT